ATCAPPTQRRQWRAMALIAVVIPTRNRGAQAAEAAAAVLRDPGDLELVVVDQSTDDKSVEALQAVGDPRLRVVRSSLRGASNAIRREALAALGGFDPFLGPGAPKFYAGEETDLIIRALHAGHRIINTTECEVLHLGVRKGSEVRKLIVGYRLSVGAAFA